MQSPNIDMDVEEFRAILGEALAEGGSQHLLRLTDEEIAVLDPESLKECIAPTPKLAELTTQERDWAYTTALRSLVSREAVEVSNIEELDAVLRSAQASEPSGSAAEPTNVDLDLRITPEVSLALTLRRAASRALAVEQHTSGSATHAIVYVHSNDLYLVERVTAGGLHIFTLASSARDAAEVVQGLIDPFEVANKDGRIQQLTPQQISEDNVGRPLSEAINSALVVGQMVLLADQPGPLVTTYATDDALWTVFIEQPHSPTGIEARPIGRSSLNKMIRRLITLPDEGGEK